MARAWIRPDVDPTDVGAKDGSVGMLFHIWQIFARALRVPHKHEERTVSSVSITVLGLEGAALASTCTVAARLVSFSCVGGAHVMCLEGPSTLMSLQASALTASSTAFLGTVQP